jgi:hypothetical protein
MSSHSPWGHQIGPFQNPDVDINAMITTIFHEIESVTKRPGEADKSFVCHDDLKTIWYDRWRIRRLLQLDYAPEEQIDFIQEHMIVILSTLISIGANDWVINFRARLFHPVSGTALATDDGIPFEIGQLTFLDSPALQRTFYECQFRFKPVVIEITQNQRTQVIENKMMRLPFEFCQKDIGSGGFGTVDRVGISPKYIKNLSEGSIWETVRTRFN